MYEDIAPKKLNPRQKANIFSQLVFAWIIPKLYKGSKQGLKEDDLPKCLHDDDSQQLGDKLERYGLKQKKMVSLVCTFQYLQALVDGNQINDTSAQFTTCSIENLLDHSLYRWLYLPILYHIEVSFQSYTPTPS